MKEYDQAALVHRRHGFGWPAGVLVTLSVLALMVLVGSASFAQAGAARVDINSATVEDLTALPGIGQSKAEAIVQEREKGRFESVDDLQRVSGIGEKTLAQIRKYVAVGSESSGP